MALVGRVGSAFAAELGTMAVSEQTDSLRMLGSDPIDYLVTPRVMACSIALPILNVMCFLMGMCPRHARVLLNSAQQVRVQKRCILLMSPQTPISTVNALSAYIEVQVPPYVPTLHGQCVLHPCPC